MTEKQVTDHALGISLYIKVRKTIVPLHTLVLKQAQRGSPQGSMLSSFLGIWIMSHLQWSGSTILINYADNFAILAKTKASAVKARASLVSQVGKLPGGTFNLKADDPQLVSQRFVFIGHSLRKKKGTIEARPAKPERLDSAISAMNDKIGRLVHGSKKNEANAQARARELALDAWYKIRSWKRAFKECDPEAVSEAAAFPESIIQMNWFSLLKISPMQANGHSNPEAEWSEAIS